MKFKRLASTLAAAAIAAGGAVSMSAVTVAPAHAETSDFGDHGFGRHGFGHKKFGHHHGFAGGAKLCVAKSVKKYVKRRGGGKFGRYFGNKRGFVVKKVAKRRAACGAWHRRHANIRHHHRRGFDHKGFGHKDFGHKGFDSKGFGHHKGSGWGW